MIDTRNYTLVHTNTNIENLLVRNNEYKKINQILTVSLLLISITAGVIIYWNHMETKEKSN